MVPELVSVVIAAYNGMDVIDVQLVALSMQDYAGPFEVIISDNGSTDGLRSHVDNHPLRKQLNMRWVDSSDRRGTPHARNVGFAASTGDLLLTVDQDDRVYPGWMSAIVAAAARYDSVSGAFETHSLNSPTVAAWRPTPPSEHGYQTHFLPVAYGNNFAVWRRVLAVIEGFDETLTGGSEDLDISWRIQQAGLTLGHAPDALVAYRLRPSYAETWRQAKGYGRTMSQVYLKHRPHGAGHTPTVVFLAAVPFVLLAFPFYLGPVRRGRWLFDFGLLIGGVQHRLAHRRW